MIGILLITHGTFGESLIQNVCHAFHHRPPQLGQIGVAAQDGPDDILPLAKRWLSELDTGSGVLILTDMLGATPSNITQQLLETGRVEGIAGVSLPMLLRALTYRNGSMETLLQKAISGGRDGVIDMLRQ